MWDWGPVVDMINPPQVVLMTMIPRAVLILSLSLLAGSPGKGHQQTSVRAGKTASLGQETPAGDENQHVAQFHPCPGPQPYHHGPPEAISPPVVVTSADGIPLKTKCGKTRN